MKLILSILIYMLFSMFAVWRIKREIHVSDWLIAFFLSFISFNILIFEILHFFSAIDQPIAFLILQFALCGIGTLFLIDPRRILFHDGLERFRISIPRPTVSEGILWGLIVVVLAVMLVLGFTGPINNLDSLHTHLPRIYYWFQHGSLEGWDATRVRQVSYPINLPLQGLWLFLMTGLEDFFFLLSYFSLAAALCLIYKVARLLGASSPAALVADVITLSFPVVLYQTFSFQGDVTIAVLALCIIYFLLQFIISSEKSGLYLAMFITGLSIGTKQTIYMALPAFALVILILLIRKKMPLRLFLVGLIFFAGSFVTLSAFKFIQNSLETEYSKTGILHKSLYSYLFSSEDGPSLQRYTVNGFRFLYQSVSLDGLAGQTKLEAKELKNRVFQSVTGALKLDLESEKYLSEASTFFSYTDPFPVNEDASWFGPLSLPVFLIVFIIGLCTRDKARKKYLWVVVLIFLTFCFGQLVLKGGGWGMNRGRYMIIPTLAFMPLAAFIVPNKKVAGCVTAALLCTASLLLCAISLTFNDSRLLVNQNDLVEFRENYVNNIKVNNAFTGLYRRGLYLISNDLIKTTPNRSTYISADYYSQLYYQSGSERKDIKALAPYLEKDRSIYVYLNQNELDYSLFGRDKSRDIYPIKSLDNAVEDYCIVVSKSLVQEFDGYALIGESDGFVYLCKQ